MQPDLTDLAVRVEALTGPDREVDAALMALAYRRGFQKLGVYDTGKARFIKSRVGKDRETGKWVSTHPFEFTGSLDAVLKLVERVRPGCIWTLCNHESGTFGASIDDRYALAATPALALLAALLHSMKDEAQ